MDKLIVYGEKKLKGEVSISGSKNAALPIMAATLLTEEDCVLKNIPRLSDIMTMCKILNVLGKDVVFEGNTLVVKHKSSEPFSAPYKLVRTMRASFCVLGPLLAQRKKAKVSLPGGCVIGVRPVDLHLKGLEALGAKIKVKGGYCYAQTQDFQGGEVFLGGHFGSSVLATANVMMAAVFARERTEIDFAACEPEVVDLANFLKAMGANIQGEGTPRIIIQPVRRLHGVEYTVIPDRIEAGTFLFFSLITQSPIMIRNVHRSHLMAVIDALKNMGQDIEMKKNMLQVKSLRAISPVNISTLPFPGFPTDLQAQCMSLLCHAQGISVITEKVYPDRFMHIAELNRMGANIMRYGSVAVIEGNRSFQGAEVMASDLRASAALIAAALAAKGKTTIHRIYHLDRGYENIDEKLVQLGADVLRKK